MSSPIKHVKQISIVTDNGDAHTVADIADRLGQAGINIDSLDAEAVAGHGVIQLTVSHYDDALNILREAGYQAMADDAMLVALEDKPGALARLAQDFRDKNITVRSMRIVGRGEEGVLVAIVAGHTAQAEALVKDIRVA